MLSDLAHSGRSVCVCVSKSVSKTLNQQVVLTKDESFFKELLKILFKEFHKAGGSSTTLTDDPTKRVKVCAEI